LPQLLPVERVDIAQARVKTQKFLEMERED
jgi:hypothetical protein